MRDRRTLTAADRVWNRACYREGDDLRDGDRALGAALLLNGYVMNGGVAHADDLEPGELAEALAGLAYFGLQNLATIVREYRGVGEVESNARYYALEGRGGHSLRDAFDAMFLAYPERFAAAVAE